MTITSKEVKNIKSKMINEEKKTKPQNKKKQLLLRFKSKLVNEIGCIGLKVKFTNIQTDMTTLSSVIFYNYLSF